MPRKCIPCFVALVGLGVLIACGRPEVPTVRSTEDHARARVATIQKPVTLGPEEIDTEIREAWQRAGLTPSTRADDSVYLRSAYLDVVGTLPRSDVTTAFLGSRDPDKRRKLVDRLLASPAYAEHWTNYWDDVLMGRDAKGPVVDRAAFREWLRARFDANAPWDKVVRELVSATGRNRRSSAEGGAPEPVNGAVNWTLRFEPTPQDLAGNASRVFLGVQIQCAQCHDHKTETWTQADFRRFASAFWHTKVEPLEAKEKGVARRVELLDLPRVSPRVAKNPDSAPFASAKATALDGTDLEKGEGTRKALATWMTARDNPWFAKAFVNRMWGHFLGRGFYDPVDDMREVNAPSMPRLLDRLALDFVAHDYDVAGLIRTLCATEAYQLSPFARPGSASNADPENKLWSRFHVVPLGPEELLNALLRATGVENAVREAGVQDLPRLRLQLERQYAFLFDVDETDDVPDYSGTVTQALSLLNGQLLGQGARVIPGSALGEVLARPGDDASKVDALVLRLLSRLPSEKERAGWVSYVQSALKQPRVPTPVPKPKPVAGGSGPLGRLARKMPPVDARRAAYEDLVWALLNSSEFVFNH